MFKKLVAYFLLLNFVNTICFYELPVAFQQEQSAALVLETEADEIDSLTEFIAEVCLNLEDNFDDGDSDDVPDHLEKTSVKHFLPEPSLSFPALSGFGVIRFKPYVLHISSNTAEVPGLPPEKFNS